MRVSYNKLWKLLIDKNMKKMDLLEAVEMSPNTLAKFWRNENVSMDVITRICEYFKCDVGDIMEMIPDEGEENQDWRGTSTVQELWSSLFGSWSSERKYSNLPKEKHLRK